MTIIISFVVVAVAVYIIFRYVFNTKKVDEKLLNSPFPPEWRKILNEKVLYYKMLPDDRKREFEKRVKNFIATKNIHGIDVDIDDTDKLLVASSAVIPMFAFAEYNYPNVREVILYPSSFDDKFRTDADTKGQRDILGMVGNGFMNGTVILSKPDLEAAFNGTRHRNNVGIHEFVHLIDKADGAVDGVPEILFQHSYALPWIKEIKKEMQKIKTGHSDINPYALTNNAEFLSVVSEYFFDNPDKMKSRHPELYEILTEIYKQQPDKFI